MPLTCSNQLLKAQTKQETIVMKQSPLLPAALLGLIGLAASSSSLAAQIDPTEKYAWSTNSGWIDHRTTLAEVTVYEDHLEGHAWSENGGWIKLGSYSGGGSHSYANSSASDWGVNRDASGNLSGYGWSSNGGWIDFSPQGGGVTIAPATGDFDGYAWGENIGWIHFQNASPAYKVSAVIPVTYTLSGGESLLEGDEGEQSRAFRVTRSRTDQASSVEITFGGSMTAGRDFDGPAVSGTGVTLEGDILNFDAGADNATLTFQLKGELVHEDDETLIATLANPTGIDGSGGELADSPQTLTLQNDDDAPAWSVNGSQLIEGDTGTFNIAFAVTLLGATEKTVSVNYATENGSATSGSDFQAASGTVTFNSGWDEELGTYLSSRSEAILVPVVGDSDNEGNETFGLRISGAVASTIATDNAITSIIDDDDGTANLCQDDSIFHSQTYTDDYYCDAATRIRAGTNLVVGSTARVIYSAPLVNLLVGTTIEQGAYFHAGQDLADPFTAARGAERTSDEDSSATDTQGTNGGYFAPMPVRLSADQLPDGLLAWLEALDAPVSAIEPVFSDGEGHWAVFATELALDAMDLNGVSDVYAYNPASGEMRLVSRALAGTAGNGASGWPVIDGRGEQIAFHSEASDLVAKDVDGVSDLFLYRTDLQTLVNLTAVQEQAAGHPAMDGEGTLVLFDRGEAGSRQIQRYLNTSEGEIFEPFAITHDSRRPAISGDGRYIVWLEGDGEARYRDNGNAMEITIPLPKVLLPVLDEVRPIFSADGGTVTWLVPGMELEVVTENPL
jgi:hypothetical protein